MPMLKGVPVLACLVFAAACTTPQRPDVPRAAEDWPRNRPAQQLPPAQPLPPPKPAWVARAVVPDAVAVATQSYPVHAGDALPRISARTGSLSDALAIANNQIGRAALWGGAGPAP